ncbi:MAG: LysR family transcriptional regulator [Lautropia sp.]
MELRQLRYFLSVLEHAAFNRAASATHVTQPALSKSMKALEDELGVELLDRSGPQIVPTAFGKILARAAHRVDGELQRAIKEIDALAERGGGKLVIGGGSCCAICCLRR